MRSWFHKNYFPKDIIGKEWVKLNSQCKLKETKGKIKEFPL